MSKPSMEMDVKAIKEELKALKKINKQKDEQINQLSQKIDTLVEKIAKLTTEEQGKCVEPNNLQTFLLRLASDISSSRDGFREVNRSKRGQGSTQKSSNISDFFNRLHEIINGLNATIESSTDSSDSESDFLSPSATKTRQYRKKETSILPTTPSSGTQPLKKVPTVILLDKSRYVELLKIIKSNNIDFGITELVPEGLTFFPKSDNDFSALTNLFHEENCPYFTEEDLRVIVRGLPNDIEIDHIMDDLKAANFNPIYIKRWLNKKGKPIGLVQVVVPKKEKAIFRLKSIMRFDVKIEAQKSHTARSLELVSTKHENGEYNPTSYAPIDYTQNPEQVFELGRRMVEKLSLQVFKNSFEQIISEEALEAAQHVDRIERINKVFQNWVQSLE